MALDLGTLVGYLEIDPTKAKTGLAEGDAAITQFERTSVPKAKAAGEKVGDALGDGMKDGLDQQESKIRDAGENAGEAAGDGLLSMGKAKALAAGAAVGVAFWEALDAGAGNDKLAASLGVGMKRQAELGKVASDLYSNAWGDSLDQVNDAIGFTIRNISGMRKASDEDLGAITSRVLDVVTAFDQDLAMTTAAVGQMMRTGMAKDAKEALDIITVGLQGPANKADDLLETFNEYGTQFRKLGLNGKQAVLLLGQGLRGGARDADIVADSLKEFSLRTQGALEQMNADGTSSLTALGSAFTQVLPKGTDIYKFQENLAQGGKKSREGLDAMLDGLRDVEDPLYRSQLAVALFGTQAEDMGDAIYSLDLDGATRKMDRFAGASDRMSNTLNDNAKSKITTFKRSVQMDLVNFLGNDVIPAIEDFADSPTAKRMWDSMTNAADDLKPLGKSILPALATALDSVGDAVEFAAPFVKDIFDAFNSLPKEMQAALVIGGTAAALSKKFTGSVNPLKAAGGLVGKTAPVPVIVMNKGFGPGGVPVPGGGGGGGGGFWKGLGAAAKGGVTPVAALLLTDWMEGLFEGGFKPGSGKNGVGAKAGQIVSNIKLGQKAGWSDKLGSAVPFLDTAGEAARKGVEEADRALADLVNGGNLKSARDQFAQLAAEAKRQGVELDDLKDKFPKYADALDKIPGKKATEFSLPNFVDAWTRILKYGRYLEDLDGDTVTTFLRTVHTKNDTGDSSRQPPNRSGPASSGGGIFTSAQWAYVGDGGAEVVRPLAEDVELRRQAAGGGVVRLDQATIDRLAEAMLLARPVHGPVSINGDPTEYKRQLEADAQAAGLSGRRRAGV